MNGVTAGRRDRKEVPTRTLFLCAIALVLAVTRPVYSQDLAFVKTANTPSNHVEVHIATAASGFQTRVLETPTTFVNESDGVWQLLPNSDLAFIKTSNTPTGHVEVHIATAASRYRTRVLETPTTFVNESDGVWQLLPNSDLGFIKTSNTPTGHVEVHIASAASGYEIRVLETPTTFVNESDGVWQLLPNSDLAFIKTSNTPTGHVEVHVASAASGYQTRVLETPTTFVNESDGVWRLAGSQPGSSGEHEQHYCVAVIEFCRDGGLPYPCGGCVGFNF
jgi:hypothetical protein